MNALLFILTIQFCQSSYDLAGRMVDEQSAVATPFARSLVVDDNVFITEAVANQLAKDPYLCRAIQNFCVANDVIGERPFGASYHFSCEGAFLNDLVWARNRYQELADAPPLRDSFGLPAKETLAIHLIHNRKIRSWMVEQRDFYGTTYQGVAFDGAIYTTDQLYRVWDLMRDAQCEFYDKGVRRMALKSLREMIGRDRYYERDWPPSVPTWLLTELK